MNKLSGFNRKGFTLIEVIVVAAIIAILAGILVPMIFNQIDESKKVKAQGECKSLHTAVTAFMGLTNPKGKLPIFYNDADCTQTATFFFSEGTAITNTWPIGANDLKFSDMLNVPIANHACYGNSSVINLVTTTPADPWGNQYISNIGAALTPGSPVWIISAGPNGVLDTSAASQTLNDTPTVVGTPGDDLGVRLQ